MRGTKRSRWWVKPPWYVDVTLFLIGITLAVAGRGTWVTAVGAVALTTATWLSLHNPPSYMRERRGASGDPAADRGEH